MKKEEWQKAYAPKRNALDIRVKNTLASLPKDTRRTEMKKAFSIVLVCMLALASVVALAAGVMVSDAVDAVKLAEKALEEKYGITKEMHTYFHRDVLEGENNNTVVTYTGIADFAYVLGTYTVTVSGTEARVVWSRDGEDTAGGLEASAWGAQQLEMALEINAQTNSFGDVYLRAMEHARAAGVSAWEAPEPEDNPVPEGYQSWTHYYRAQALPVMEISPKEALALAQAAIAECYGLTQEQTDKMEWHDTWTDFGMKDDQPVLCVWYSLCQNPDAGWTLGDGLYGADVNVETGVIEAIYYDSALAGNG